MTKKKQSITVIIRCKNEERWIGHAIQSILDHLDKPEIIIIDNFSSDQTINIVKNFIADPLLNKNRNYTNIKIFQLKHLYRCKYFYCLRNYVNFNWSVSDYFTVYIQYIIFFCEY